jgi:hypothetical protein
MLNNVNVKRRRCIEDEHRVRECAEDGEAAVADAGTKSRWDETASKTNQARLLDKNSLMIIA